MYRLSSGDPPHATIEEQALHGAIAHAPTRRRMPNALVCLAQHAQQQKIDI